MIYLKGVLIGFGSVLLGTPIALMEISPPGGNGFFQPAGSGKSLVEFRGLLGSHYCAIHRGLRAVYIPQEEITNRSRLALLRRLGCTL